MNASERDASKARATAAMDAGEAVMEDGDASSMATATRRGVQGMYTRQVVW
jgi:hypothetical protein